MLDSIIKLIRSETVRDDTGVINEKLASREVFCGVSSVTRQEFFNAGRSGLNPSFVFLVFAGDYAGETMCIYEGQSYAIYRAYRPEDSDYIELYVQREGGTNGKDNVGFIC